MESQGEVEEEEVVRTSLSISLHLQLCEPRRKLQTSWPLGCAEERAAPRQSGEAKALSLNEHHNSICVCVCVCVHVCDSLLAPSPLLSICVALSSRGSGGRVDKVTLTQCRITIV